jgi:hypothetical protein
MATGERNVVLRASMASASLPQTVKDLIGRPSGFASVTPSTRARPANATALADYFTEHPFEPAWFSQG